MASLSAVEPCQELVKPEKAQPDILTERRSNSDLHRHLWWVYCQTVVDVGHETRVHPARKRYAGLGERRLCHGVVLRLELEFDHVANICLDGAWTVN